jgi:hypothetical protein
VAACGKTPRNDSVHLPSLGNGLDTACHEKGRREGGASPRHGTSVQGRGRTKHPLGHDRLHEKRSFFQQDVHNIVPDMYIRGVYEANIRIIYAE